MSGGHVGNISLFGLFVFLQYLSLKRRLLPSRITSKMTIVPTIVAIKRLITILRLGIMVELKAATHIVVFWLYCMRSRGYSNCSAESWSVRTHMPLDVLVNEVFQILHWCQFWLRFWASAGIRLRDPCSRCTLSEKTESLILLIFHFQYYICQRQCLYDSWLYLVEYCSSEPSSAQTCGNAPLPCLREKQIYASSCEGDCCECHKVRSFGLQILWTFYSLTFHALLSTPPFWLTHFWNW